MNTETKKKSVHQFVDDSKMFDHWKVKGIVAEIAGAYSDSHDLNAERNLNFFSRLPLQGKDFLNACFLCIPSYNAWDGKRFPLQLLEFFGEGTEFFIAREGSVCIYVRPGQAFDLISTPKFAKQIEVDEFGYDPTFGLIRLWWD